MIDHELKCIFIHIQRTAGTSIEEWLCGQDWWFVEQKTKHVIASQARDLYSEYWDSYFKFSFVRNPVDRVISCLKYRDHFGIGLEGNEIEFKKYFDCYGEEIILEHDQRFYSRSDLINNNHVKNAIYSNILDEDIDFIGKYENLIADTKHIKNQLKIKNDFDIHAEKSDNRISYRDLSQRSLDEIYRIYSVDIERFRY
ncbi:sulfotransferase family 2 domain-containing protein [Methylobacterium sp. EM32]|uniref:sulfotransferase family 2 domain-containing protein n=1 Tax=Methylobacterium sp. EM32 TaxID=3163481 RepID=UPI0033B35944